MAEQSTKGIREGLAKKVASVATAGVLAVSLMPLPAFADAGGSSDGGWFALPSTHIDSFVHSDGSSYLSSGIERVVGGFSQSMYYLMGINGVNFDRGLRNNDPLSQSWTDGSVRKITTDAVTAVDGIMGTSVNIHPDEYLWNSCYRLYQGRAFQSVAGEEDTEVHINAGNVSAYETVAVNVGGAEYAMPVPIYHEANFISDTDGEWTTSKNVASWVAIENQREGRPYTTPYDPYIASWTTNSGGIDFGCELMYKLADAVDKVSAASGGKLTSRYVDGVGADAAMYKTATDLATDYEYFAKATQWATIEQLAKNPDKKKTVAILCGYQPATTTTQAAYACRVFNPVVDGKAVDMHNQANYGGRLANSITNIADDITEKMPSTVTEAFAPNATDAGYVKWYYASDIAENADAIFVCDAPYGNERANYLAINQDNTKASIYTVDNNSYDKFNENVNPMISAVNAANADGHNVDMFYKYPNHLFGVWYAQGFENNWLAPISAAYLYSGDGLFPSVENVMAYAARKFWHINEADVKGVLAATCYDISLPSNDPFSTDNVSANYISDVQAVIDAGKTYYEANKSTIDVMNNGDIKKIDVASLTGTSDAAMTTTAVKASSQTPADFDDLTAYRLYNPNSSEHFFTTDPDEYAGLGEAGWNQEGEAWTSPKTSASPVYRVYNPNAGDHHYTTSADERDWLVQAGWQDEGIGWFSASDAGKPLYRLYNPNATGAGAHHYTLDTSERDYLKSLGWNDEGIGWYGIA